MKEQIFIFNKSLDRMYELVKNCIPRPELKIRQMQSDGALCRKRKLSYWNLDPIKTPNTALVCYAHELIHLSIDTMIRSSIILTSLMPDWKQRKKALDEEITKY